MNSALHVLRTMLFQQILCRHRVLSLSMLLVALVSASCSSRRVTAPAPVEDRSAAKAPAEAAAIKALPGAENAGKPGYYTVQPGDTLFRIALDNGQHWRDLQTWNNLSNPNIIEVGQVLRVVPTTAANAAMAPSASAVAPSVTSTPIAGNTITPRPLNSTPSDGTAIASSAPGATGATPATAPANVPAGDAITFVWPAQGGVIETFDEVKNKKGVSIAGKLGDAVLAAADGRVVYAGAGLRGYGNLIILKHNNTYLTAYAHNQALLVSEDQVVRQGQKIAEMGNSDADRVKLHFEVRRQGKPVDPLGFLPKR